MEDHQKDDLAVVAEVLQGNSDSFRLIIRKYQGSIFRICRSYLKNREEAEDAVQEIFTRAFRSLGSFRLEKRFQPWLYSITFNHLKTRYRRILTFTKQKEELENSGFLEQNHMNETPAAVLERQEQIRMVQDALSRLPARLKDSAFLYYIEEMSVSEVAEVLDLSEENVKSRLFRARKKLREFLEQDATAEVREGYTTDGMP